MVTARSLLSLSVFLAMVAGSAHAQTPQGGAPAPTPAPVPPKPGVAPLVGATEVLKLLTPSGFIDDVATADDSRIAFFVTELGTKTELHIYTLLTKKEEIVDVSAVTLQPVAVALVGQRAFIVGTNDSGAQNAALVELRAIGKKPAGAVVYKIGPANAITLIQRDGKQRVAVHKVSTTGGGTKHDVEVLAIENGKRVGAARSLELDGSDKNEKLGFKVNHWSDGMTRAHGIKAGEWDRKEDQRAPDVEATYDLISGKFSDKKKIEDLFEQRRRFQALVDAGKRLDFIRLDLKGLELWRAGKGKPLELDQPLTNYDTKSMQGIVNADGSAWVILKMDPVNADAVARKKADPEYLDIFRVTADGKGTRKARVFAGKARYRFGVMGENFWLIERTNGFERGGKSVALYSIP